MEYRVNNPDLYSCWKLNFVNFSVFCLQNAYSQIFWTNKIRNKQKYNNFKKFVCKCTFVHCIWVSLKLESISTENNLLHIVSYCWNWQTEFTLTKEIRICWIRIYYINTTCAISGAAIDLHSSHIFCCMFFAIICVHWITIQFPYQMIFVLHRNNRMYVTSGTWTADNCVLFYV